MTNPVKKLTDEEVDEMIREVPGLLDHMERKMKSTGRRSWNNPLEFLTRIRTVSSLCCRAPSCHAMTNLGEKLTDEEDEMIHEADVYQAKVK